jgi:hypothetical protein
MLSVYICLSKCHLFPLLLFHLVFWTITWRWAWIVAKWDRAAAYLARNSKSPGMDKSERDREDEREKRAGERVLIGEEE